jgi:hypothetical protein
MKASILIGGAIGSAGNVAVKRQGGLTPPYCRHRPASRRQ